MDKEKNLKTQKALEKLLPLVEGENYYLKTEEFVSIFKEVAKTIRTLREENQNVSDAVISQVDQMVSSLVKASKENADATERLKTELGGAMDSKIGALEEKTKTLLENTKKALDEISKIEVRDGIDADEEVIIDAVLSKIKLPESTVLDTGEIIVDKINELEITPDKQIDARHIKGLPANSSGTFVGTVSGIKEIIAGANITVDNTNLGYPVVSSTGGGGGGGGTWGSITGTLSSQTDLQNALNAKQGSITLTTTGSSGAATLVGDTLNVPQYSAGGSYLPLAGGTMTGGIVLATGSTTVAPIKMVAGTNLTTPVAGVFEFDGTNLYFSI